MLVFVNPFGGKGRGKKMWEERIFDIFKMADVKCKVSNKPLNSPNETQTQLLIPVKVITTERANHALDLLQTMDLKRFDGIISVGGDGMFAEVF